MAEPPELDESAEHTISRSIITNHTSTRDGLSLYVGQEFSCYSDFQNVLSARSKEYSEKWNMDNGGKTVKQANAAIRNPALHFKEEFKYSYVKLKCIHGGQARGRGGTKRSRPSKKLDCPAFVILSARRRMDKLVVLKVDLLHNHELIPESRCFYPSDRKPTEAERVEIIALSSVGLRPGRIMAHMKETTGKVFLRHDIYNIRSRVGGTDSAQKKWLNNTILKRFKQRENVVSEDASVSASTPENVPPPTNEKSRVSIHVPTRENVSTLLGNLEKNIMSCGTESFIIRYQILLSIVESWKDGRDVPDVGTMLDGTCSDSSASQGVRLDGPQQEDRIACTKLEDIMDENNQERVVQGDGEGMMAEDIEDGTWVWSSRKEKPNPGANRTGGNHEEMASDNRDEMTLKIGGSEAVEIKLKIGGKREVTLKIDDDEKERTSDHNTKKRQIADGGSPEKDCCILDADGDQEDMMAAGSIQLKIGGRREGMSLGGNQVKVLNPGDGSRRKRLKAGSSQVIELGDDDHQGETAGDDTTVVKAGGCQKKRRKTDGRQKKRKQVELLKVDGGDHMKVVEVDGDQLKAVVEADGDQVKVVESDGDKLLRVVEAGCCVQGEKVGGKQVQVLEVNGEQVELVKFPLMKLIKEGRKLMAIK